MGGKTHIFLVVGGIAPPCPPVMSVPAYRVGKILSSDKGGAGLKGGKSVKGWPGINSTLNWIDWPFLIQKSEISRLLAQRRQSGGSGHFSDRTVSDGSLFRRDTFPTNCRKSVPSEM